MLTFNSVAGTSLVVQWLRFCAPNARGWTLIPGWGTTFRMPQQSKIPGADCLNGNFSGVAEMIVFMQC